jgi:nucleoid-associated protein YgaU
MISTSQVSLTRCLAVGAGATAGCGLLVGWLLPVALSAGPATFDAALVRVCAASAVVAACWLWLATVSTVRLALRGRAQYAAGLPAPLRRAVLAACGVALTGGLVVAGPAHATPGRVHEDRVVSTALAGLALPDRATARPAPRAEPTIVVARGDTLWSIAARRLGPGASDAEIDACWRRLYDLNRAEIGADPDLIHPAQRLEVQP